MRAPETPSGSRIAETLAVWRSRLQDVVEDDAFEAMWTETWAWVTDAAVAPAIDSLLDSPGGARWAEALEPFQRRSLNIQETREASRLMSAQWDPDTAAGERVRSVFGRQTYDRVAEVLRLADFAACRRFVMVGCGAFPAAALLVRDMTAVAEIVALDVDRSAAATARRVVEAMGEHRVRVDCAEGAGYDYAGAGIVYLANQVSHKGRVLARILESAPADAVVVVREPYSVGRLVAECVSERLPPPFRIAVRGGPCPAFYSRHVLLARDAV